MNILILYYSGVGNTKMIAAKIFDLLHGSHEAALASIEKPVPAFLFTTCGLYSANTLRIFAKQCQRKNIIPILSKSYRCAATDGILIAPAMNVWSYHEKQLDKKVENDVSNFLRRCNNPAIANIPRFKLYSILNYPNKFLGQRFSPPPIYTHKKIVLIPH